MVVITLCAGEQERWGDNGNPKQLVDVGGEPLLARLVRQCRRAGHEPVIVTHDERLTLSDRTYVPGKRRWTVETLLSTRFMWGDRTVVLLGDVVYTRDALDKILSSREPFQVFGRKELRYRLAGRYYEIFALSFDQTQAERVEDTLNRAISMIENGKAGWGKLRLLYELWCGLPLGEFAHEDVVFYPIEDATEDIDAPEDYEQFRVMIINPGRLDDRP